MSNTSELIIQTMIKLSCKKDVISFAAGLPDSSLFPINDLSKSMLRVCSSHNLQYTAPSFKLKNKICKIMDSFLNLNTHSENILLTNGAQQGLSLLINFFLKKHYNIVIDQYTYPGVIQILNEISQLTPNKIKILEYGISIHKALKKITKDSEKYIYYTVPNGHNPTSKTISKDERKEIAKFADKNQNLVIIEDDPYHWICYNEERYDPITKYTKNSFYVGSFSKIIGPSLRTGWIIGDTEIIKTLQNMKDMSDLNNATFAQHILADYLEVYSLESHVAKLKNIYREKRDLMIEGIKKYFPPYCKYEIPHHGMFIFVEFPSHINLSKYHMDIASEYKVLYIPGKTCSLNKESDNFMRLNFTLANFDQISKGIEKLGKALYYYYNGF